MKKKLHIRLTALALAAAASMGFGSAYALSDDFVGTYVFWGDSDNSGGGEYAQLLAGNGNGSVTAVTAFSPGSGTPDEANGEGSLQMLSPGYTSITVDSNDNGSGGLYVWSGNGAGNAANMIASTAQSTSIRAYNSAGTATTGELTVNNGSINMTSNLNTITGATNINTTGTATTTIGNVDAAVNVNGTTKINEDVNAATSINTGTSTGNVTVGNSANTTSLNSATNNIGNTGFATTNNIGNAQTNTQVNAQAGNAKMTLANNSAVLTVPTSSATENTLNGFDANGTRSTMTGGNTSPTRMTLNDTAATFSRVSNGAPITVTGVADGRADFDAVNVRQFAHAVAAVSAQANIPGLQQGQEKSVGVGVGNFMGKTALALGLNMRASNSSVFRVSVATGTTGDSKPIVGAGAAWAF